MCTEGGKATVVQNREVYYCVFWNVYKQLVHLPDTLDVHHAQKTGIGRVLWTLPLQQVIAVIILVVNSLSLPQTCTSAG